jgi:TolB-like protein
MKVNAKASAIVLLLISVVFSGISFSQQKLFGSGGGAGAGPGIGIGPIPVTPEVSEKERIAVFDFSRSALNAPPLYEKSVCEKFTYVVVKLGRFSVVEREKLASVMKELKLSLSGLVDPNTAAQAGKLLGAKYIITGDLRDYGQKYEAKEYKVTIGVTVKIIEVATAEIIDALEVEGSGSGGDAGTARKEALDAAADKFYYEIRKVFALKTYILKREGNVVYIRFGEKMGVKKGTRFTVLREGESVTDPYTGEVYTATREVGEVVVSEVTPKFAKATIVSEKESIKPGDSVKEIVTRGINVSVSFCTIPLSRGGWIFYTSPEKVDIYWIYNEIKGGYGANIAAEKELSNVMPDFFSCAGVVLGGGGDIFYLDLRLGLKKYLSLSSSFKPYCSGGVKLALASISVPEITQWGEIRVDKVSVSAVAFGVEGAGGLIIGLFSKFGLFVEGEYNLNTSFSSWKYNKSQDDKHPYSIEDYSRFVPDAYSSGLSFKAGIVLAF